MTGAVALLAFGLFIVAVIVGIRWLLGQDTNRADTALTLYVIGTTRALAQLGVHLKDLTFAANAGAQACRDFNEAFRT